LTTKASPSSTARVERLARSEPASGSDIPTHHTVSPLIAAGAIAFCSSSPNSSSDGPTMA